MPEHVISAELRDLVTDLVLQQQKPSSWALSATARDVLERELELVLTDREQLNDYVRLLQRLLGGTCPSYELLEGEEEQRVLLLGLKTLPVERLRRLAVDSVALLGLRDSIFEYENRMPDYWWAVVKNEAIRQGQWKSVEEVYAELFPSEGGVEEARELVALAPDPHSFPGPATKDTWRQRLSLQEASWRDRGDAALLAKHRVREVVVAFSYHPGSAGKAAALLTTVFEEGPLLPGRQGVSLKASLHEPTGPASIEAELRKGEAVFRLPTECRQVSSLKGWKFACHYSWTNKYEVELVIVLDPRPSAAAPPHQP
jgi:hypothetical protein